MFVINEKPEKPFLQVLFEQNESKMILYLLLYQNILLLSFEYFNFLMMNCKNI